jgi:hypothetical protein
MPDAAIADSVPTNDIASLTGGGPPTSSSAIADLTKLKKQQIGEETAVMGKENRTIDRDQARMEAAYKAEGVETEALKPWNANKEHEKFETDPIQGIGSVGSIFAVIASAFTKAPATNAIEGMAGAINAIKDGKEVEFSRAWQSYKDNTKLALERQKIQHEQYQDAASLMASNMAAGQAKMHNLAVKFGDQNTLMFLEHGMNKELFEMQAAQADSAEKWAQYSETLTKHHFQKLAVDEIAKNPPNTGDPVADKVRMAAQIQRVYDGNGKYGTAEQEAVGRYVMEHQNDPPDKFAEGLADVHQQFSVKAPNIEGYQNAKQAWQDQHPGETLPAAEDAKMLQEFGLSTGPRGGALGAGGSTTESKVIAAEIQRRTAEYVSSGMSQSEAFDRAEKEVKTAQKGPGTSSQAEKTKAINEIIAEHKANGETIDIADAEGEYNRRKAAPSGNRIDDLRSKSDQTDNIITGINNQLDTLNKIKGVSGLAGKIMRGEEIVGNVAGTTDTDRVEFRRRVHELQELVPRILTDASGRPLKSAQDKVDDIVAGLNAGDTGPNTIRAYKELLSEMQKRQADYRGRLEGSHKAGEKSSGSSAPASAPPTDDSDWLKAYPEKGGGVGPRSDAGDSPPVPGAQKAPDGKWYVKDPDRGPGKYLRVEVG